jgi:ELWxxDGT repeat protein
VMLRDVGPGTVAGVLDHRDNLITTVAGRSLFTGDDGSGREPWVTDGTPDGTHRIADLNPGVVDSAPYAVGTLGDTVVLGATVAGEDRLYTWSPTWAPDPDPVTAAPRPSTTTAHPKRHYPAVRARHGRIVVPVTVAAADGSAVSGGSVTLVLHGRVVGTAPLAGGTARVRITKHLRPHRRYVVTATWSGTSTTAGSSSAPFRVRVAAR